MADNDYDEFVNFLAVERGLRRGVFIPMLYLDIMGDMEAAAVLAQIVYWHGETQNGKQRLVVSHGGHKWLARSYAEWEAELRLSEHKMRSILKRMAGMGIITSKIYKFGGAPTLHIRLIYTQFLEIVHSRSLKNLGMETSKTSGTMETSKTSGTITDTEIKTEKKNAPNGAGGEKPKAKSGPEPVPEPVPVPEPQDGDSSDTVGISGKAVSGKGITPPPARPLTAHQRLVGVLATRHGIAEGSPVPRPLASRLGKQVKILRGELCAEGLDLRVEFDDLPDLIRGFYAGWNKNYTIPTDGVKLAGEVREYVGTGKRAGHLPRDVNELLAEREQWGGA